MADGVFNIAKGAARQLMTDNPNALAVLLLKVSEADGTLVDHDNVSDLLASAGNTEADFTNYARKTGLTDTIDIDDALDEVSAAVANQTWTSAGGATDNTLVKLIVAVQTGADDTTLVPLTHHDFPVTTDGTDLTAQFNADGFYGAS